jgi:hypothetical protein
MKGFIWNSDGFGDPAKHLAIKEAVRDFNLDFVVISETGRGSFLAPLPSKPCCWYGLQLVLLAS